MHLKRVRVPDFRVLKDIDITFEPDLVPRIFPLGSLNGGGKSTLLQLIFTLLHCCVDKNRIPYLQNTLDGFEIDINLSKKELATIEITTKEGSFELNFFCCTKKYINEYISSRINVKRYIDEERNFQINENCLHICDLYQLETTHIKIFLLCEFSEVKSNILVVLKSIQNKIFLAAPITQVFRFVDKEDRNLLFKSGDSINKYHSSLKNVKYNLPGFFLMIYLL